MLAYLVALALRLAFGPQVTFTQWQAWSARPLAATVLVTLALALFAHAWVGIRDVVLDYVRPLGLRLVLLGGVATGLAVLALWITLIFVHHMNGHV